MPRQRFLYRPTELGQDTYERGGLEGSERAVFMAFRGSRSRLPIDKIRDELLTLSGYMGSDLWPGDLGYDEVQYKEDSYVQGKYLELAEPLKLRETINSMVRKGLLRKI